MDFAAVAELCAPGVAPDTLARIASVESSFNQYAIGVVGGRLERQPRSLAEAVATAHMLAANGYDFSVGVMQVNERNFGRFGLTIESAFDPCRNLRTGASIYADCLNRAGGSASAHGDALSCYYSGNFITGYKSGYVSKVMNAGIAIRPTVQVIPPAIRPTKFPQRDIPTAAASAPTQETMFVSASQRPSHHVANGDVSATPKRPGTALLF